MVEVGLAVAFVAGVATFASPCCLPMVPVWIGYIVGGTPAGQRTNRLVALQQSLAFVVGFAVVFVGLWASIGLVGYLLRGYVDVIRQVAGVLLIVMGLHVAGLITIPFLRNQVSLGGRLVRRDASGAVVATRPSVLRSALFGVVFAAGWTSSSTSTPLSNTSTCSLRERVRSFACELIGFSFRRGTAV